MNGIGRYNAAGLLLALGLSAAWFSLVPRPQGARHLRPTRAAAVAVEARTVVTDARGVEMPVRDFRRIVSASIVADELLWRLCAPDRIAAFTTQGKQHALFGHRYLGKPAVEGLRQLEAVMALRPDLVVISHFADARHVARLEETGITVFDLGEMFGVESLTGDIRDVADLVGNPRGGQRLARELRRGLDAVASDRRGAPRPRAIYLSVYGKKLFGGTRGSSYHDVMEAAGLQDVAAAQLSGWPELEPERVLSMRPELVVTKAGMEHAVCAYPGLSRLPACERPGHVVGVTDYLIDDPGLTMIDAAQELHDVVFGPGGPGAKSPR